MVQTVSLINGLENKISQLSQEELCRKTEGFKIQIQREITPQAEAVKQTEELYRSATSSAEKEQLNEELKKAKADLNRTIEISLDKIFARGLCHGARSRKAHHQYAPF